MPFTLGIWATVIFLVAMVTASQLLTDKIWRRSVDVVEFEETSSGVSQYLLTTFSAFCSQGKGCLVIQIIQHIIAYFSVSYVINRTSAMIRL
jgi:hypothetical protein